MPDSNEETLLIDAHVHIYSCFNVDKLLDAAAKNFTLAAKKMSLSSHRGVLLLTETKRDNWFSQALKTVNNSRWQIEKTQDTSVLIARPDRDSSNFIYIVAGRQIVTAEGLEVLALLSDSSFDDGLSINATLSAVREQDAIPVLPWAVGKWLGKRGKVLSSLLKAEADSDLCLGDNSGRPVFWYNPSHFKQARSLHLPILPGSDPLPLAAEAKRVGSFGFALSGRLSQSQPAADLKRLLRAKEAEFISYGQLDKPWHFFLNQIRLRMN